MTFASGSPLNSDTSLFPRLDGAAAKNDIVGVNAWGCLVLLVQIKIVAAVLANVADLEKGDVAILEEDVLAAAAVIAAVIGLRRIGRRAVGHDRRRRFHAAHAVRTVIRAILIAQ